MESTITRTEMHNLIAVGKTKKLISIDEVKILNLLSKEKLITRECYGNTTFTTEQVVYKSKINLKDIDNNFLKKLIQIQKYKINTFENKNFTLLSEKEDGIRFKSALRREKIYNWLFFIMTLVVIPSLIILTLCLLAPAVIPVYINFSLNFLTAPLGGIMVFASLTFLPIASYFTAVFYARNSIEKIVGKNIFTGKKHILDLSNQLDKEVELLNRLVNHAVSREENLSRPEEPNITLRHAIFHNHQEIPAVNATNNRNCLFPMPSPPPSHVDNSEDNITHNHSLKA